MFQFWKIDVLWRGDEWVYATCGTLAFGLYNFYEKLKNYADSSLRNLFNFLIILFLKALRKRSHENQVVTI